MKNTVSKVLVVVAMVVAIVGLVCIGVSMMDLANRWVLISGQICVIIGMVLTLVGAYRKNAKKN